MKDPVVIPWFLLTIGVLVWRLIKGWLSLFHLVAFGLAALTMAIMEEALVTRDVGAGIARAWGGTVLLTAGYWAFFDKVRDEKPPDVVRTSSEPTSSAEGWSERLLIGVLALQVALELMLYADLTPVPWFQLIYGAHLIAVAVVVAFGGAPVTSKDDRQMTCLVHHRGSTIRSAKSPTIAAASRSRRQR